MARHLFASGPRRVVSECLDDVDLMTGEQPYKVRIAQNAQELFNVNARAEQMRDLFAESIAADLVA